MKKRGNFQRRFRLRNLLRQFKREVAFLYWNKLIYDHIMNGHGTPPTLKGVCSGEGGVAHGPMLAMVGDDPDRKELFIPDSQLEFHSAALCGSDISVAFKRIRHEP